MLTKMHSRFIFWLLIILSYRNGFNSIWLSIAKLSPKNIENCKKVQTKKRFQIYVSACLRKCTTDLSFECRLCFSTEMVLTQHGSTVLNWCLKTLKAVKKFKQRNVSIFSWVHVYKNATNIFNKVRVYRCKFTSSIKTGFQSRELNVKHEQ